MSKLKQTQQQGLRTLVAIGVIGVAVYLGFTPLFELVPAGVPQAVISSSFGAIFVIVLTMYLLNKQTEIEQESKKSERVFDEKVKLYQSILEITKEMLADGNLSKDEINKLPFPVMRLQMLGGEKTIETYTEIYSKLNDIYQSSEADDVQISEDQKDDIYELLMVFAGQCRSDIGISDDEIDSTILKSAVNTIVESGKKKKDFTRFPFDGENLAKNQYVFRVIQNFVKNNPDITLEEFPAKVIERSDLAVSEGKRKNDFEIWKTYDEAIDIHKKKGSKRYFVTKRGGDYLKDKDMVLSLKDAEICISNQWGIDNMKGFIDLMKSKNIRTE